MITKQSVNELTVANEKRLNASLNSEVEALRKQIETAIEVETKLREDATRLRAKYD